MSTNGVNDCEDAEMECDSEKVVTMMDVLQEQEDFEEDANAVLGASDDKNCTYPKGYIKRQAIYACMTCCADAKDDPAKRAGVCLACSLNCHENHELIELYTKRNFRCDCGNPKFNMHPCQFTPNKIEINEDNVYNQNFGGLYCICHRPYPDPENILTEQEMIQCIICEDWLHSSHLDATVPHSDQYTEMICKVCMEKNEFLHDYNDLTVNKEDMEIDILHTSLDLNDVTKSNGLSNNETVIKTSEHQINMGYNDDNTKQCNTGQQHENSSDLKGDLNEDPNEMIVEQQKSLANVDPTLPDAHVSKCEKNPDGFKINQNDDTKSSPDNTCDIMLKTERKNNEQTEEFMPLISSDCDKINSEAEQQNIASESKIAMDTTIDTFVAEIKQEKMEDFKESKTSIDDTSDEIISKTKESINDQIEEFKSATDNISYSVTATEQNINAIKENNEITEEIKTTTESILESGMNEKKTELNTANVKPLESTEKLDCLSQKQVGKDLLHSDPVIAVQDKNKEIDNVNNIQIITKDTDKIKSKPSDTKNSADHITENEVQENIQTESGQTMIEQETKENAHNEKSNGDKLTSESVMGGDVLKRKHVDGNDDSEVKKLKLDESCVRPKEVKKVHRGATFWPSNFRHKLCTCNECVTMYKDLSVLFLIDPEDTVTAYERLGKERTDGKPVSQYEKGMAALSSLGRVQQINALTEYTKLRDKLLEFLKSFKDRKVIVKEEDIKAFFAGMKPVREPDGVYFCR